MTTPDTEMKVAELEKRAAAILKEAADLREAAKLQDAMPRDVRVTVVGNPLGGDEVRLTARYVLGSEDIFSTRDPKLLRERIVRALLEGVADHIYAEMMKIGKRETL